MITKYALRISIFQGDSSWSYKNKYKIIMILDFWNLVLVKKMLAMILDTIIQIISIKVTKIQHNLNILLFVYHPATIHVCFMNRRHS